MNFESLFDSVLDEQKRAKLKPLTGLDYYQSIRKPTPPPGTSFKDKKKYNRKQKHKANPYNESINSSKTAWSELQNYLKNKGINTADMYDVLVLVNKICKGE